MSTEPVLDLNALLTPLSPEAPSGVDLREDTSPQSIYYRLKDARSTARATERRNDAGEESDDDRDGNLVLRKPVGARGID